ncbi:MAG: hypothetical protein M3Y04_02310, partial [Actinomycetota bacterium]|nr:hypothetical protein [Actinomycetota bacterium]
MGAVVGVLVVLALAVFPALSDTFEGTGPKLNVTESDNLPDSATVTVVGTGFGVPATTIPEGTLPPPTTSGYLYQCDRQTQRCVDAGGVSVLDGGFTTSLIVTRMLDFGGSPVDCAPRLCYVRVEADGSFADHHLSFAVTTTTSSTVTGETTTSTRPPVGGTVVPPTTLPPVTVPRATTTSPTTTTSTSTTLATTTTTRRPTTTSTVRTTVPTTSTVPSTPKTLPPPTTPPPPPPPPPAGNSPSSLVAVTPQHKAAGPPGSGLEVSGTGYTCSTVYFFFDGTRVGSDAPDGSGNASRHGLSVPGDARSGRHRVTSSCDASGNTVVQASFFQVLPASVHRPAFVTALPLPADVSLDPGKLLLSAVVATGMILLIAFPYELFNSTVEENYDEIRGWFGLPPRDPAAVKLRENRIAFVGLTMLTAVACGFLSPD